MALMNKSPKKRRKGSQKEWKHANNLQFKRLEEHLAPRVLEFNKPQPDLKELQADLSNGRKF